jgi:hypothetical protein
VRLIRKLPVLTTAIMTPLVTVSLLGAIMAPTSASAATGAAAATCARPSGAVSCSPRTLTPAFPVSTSKTFQIRQIVQCGSTMYAVGSFTKILSPNLKGSGRTTFIRNNVFSFSAKRPYRVTSWRPNVNGAVNSIAVGGKNCSTAYLGGSFTRVNSRAARNIAAVSTKSGRVLTRFRSNANNSVETLLLHGGKLFTGGYFTSINGSTSRYLVGLNPTTGATDHYFDLGISGNYQYPGVSDNPTRVWNQQVSPNGGRLLVEGDFTSVGGQPRQQIFMLDLGKNKASVTGWTSSMFNQNCATSTPFYVRSAAWGPTGKSIYTANTGFQPPGQTDPHRVALCDSLARWPVNETNVNPIWINYTGCDSLYSVAAGYGTVYAGGHERWADNGEDCDNAGPGSVPAQGMGGFNEDTGNVLLNARHTKGLYSRSRGLGADDMLLTKDGLWIASDNDSGTTPKGNPFNTDSCNGVSGRSGLCFLPK